MSISLRNQLNYLNEVSKSILKDIQDNPEKIVPGVNNSLYYTYSLGLIHANIAQIKDAIKDTPFNRTLLATPVPTDHES